ncbi:hypothetical protein FG379_002560 [Cryptosporidium bovis]|uniref:uncharacterized protein n=1 Tax=Cryptosporidium bovis TaxID=310047 RepID=UPI00351A2E13|nr:hypothetical protein FG379_002560 [Cryptosporidium bovis]
MNIFDENSTYEYNKMFKNISGNNVSNELINTENFTVKDFMQSFINSENINAEKQRNSDLPRFQYTFSKGDNFNSRLIGGCSSCGAALDLMFSIGTLSGENNPKTAHLCQKGLKCKMCSYKSLKLHNIDVSDSIVRPRTKNTLCSSSFYIVGIRNSMNFGSYIRWWMKPKNYKNTIRLKYIANNAKTSKDSIRILDAMQKKKAPRIKETCPECSHEEAFFTQFQARSADEGTSVMYECCKCRHRRVINN